MDVLLLKREFLKALHRVVSSWLTESREEQVPGHEVRKGTDKTHGREQ